MQQQWLHHEIATAGDSKICSDAQTLNRLQQQRPGPETAPRSCKRLNKTPHLVTFSLILEAQMRLSNTACGGGVGVLVVGGCPHCCGKLGGRGKHRMTAEGRVL